MWYEMEAECNSQKVTINLHNTIVNCTALRLEVCCLFEIKPILFKAITQAAHTKRSESDKTQKGLHYMCSSVDHNFLRAHFFHAAMKQSIITKVNGHQLNDRCMDCVHTSRMVGIFMIKE